MNNDIEYVRKDLHDLEITQLNQRIDDSRDDINRNLQFHSHLITIIAIVFAGVKIGIALFLYILTR